MVIPRGSRTLQYAPAKASKSAAFKHDGKLRLKVDVDVEKSKSIVGLHSRFAALPAVLDLR